MQNASSKAMEGLTVSSPVTVLNNHAEDAKTNTAKKLLSDLNQLSDLVIDFSSLKTCLNPMGLEVSDSQEQNIDYEELVHDLIEKQSETLPQLQKLTIRKSLKNEQYDQRAQLNHGILQLSCLSELDLSELPESHHDQLQLWNLHNLKKLAITQSKLKTFPGSVGRLSKLEELNLSCNYLSSLPTTLSFCKKLITLDLQTNRFCQLPGVVLRLPSLKNLKRFENPLTPRYAMAGPKYIRQLHKKPDSKEKKVYQPLSLQASCTTVIFTSELKYWETNMIGPLQCKTLDRLAEQFNICENCNRMLKPEHANNYSFEVLLVTFAELSGVPFKLTACSDECLTNLMNKYGELNVELQKNLDEAYQASIKKAIEEAKVNGGVDWGPAPTYTPLPPWDTIPPWQPTQHNRRHRKKRCTIM